MLCTAEAADLEEGGGDLGQTAALRGAAVKHFADSVALGGEFVTTSYSRRVFLFGGGEGPRVASSGCGTREDEEEVEGQEGAREGIKMMK